jgi:hypothetical protein
MTDQNALEALRDRPVRSDSDVVALVGALLLPVVRRQCWLLFLDEASVPVQLLVPIDDLPDTPEDDGVQRFATTMAEVVPDVGATHIVVAWERPGPPDPSDTDLAWSRAVDVALGRAGVPLRAQVLVHDDGVTPIHERAALAA